MQAVFTLLNITLIFTGTLKFMQYVRVYTKIGWIVELVSQTLQEVTTFGFFYFFIVLVFGTIFMVAGVNTHDQSVESNFIYWISVFRYSIGNIYESPTYPYWEQQKDSGTSVVVVLLILTVFVFQLVLMMVILLNFLIAVIS